MIEEQKTKVIFIVSLPFSGSTILNIELGKCEQIVSLGEIGNAFLAKYIPEKCTCGSLTAECAIWGDELLDGQPFLKENLKEKYETLLDKVQSSEGGKAVCDSYKSILAFPEILKSKKIEPLVLFISKDIRNWTSSALKKKHFSINSKPIPKFLKLLYFAIYWSLKNRSFKKQLDTQGVNYHQVGYEEFCLDTETAMSRISSFVNFKVNVDDKCNEKNGLTSHVLKGNSIRFDDNSNKSLTYRYSWLKESNWLVALITLPFVHLNRKYVYFSK